eukprot:COSAG02_NODE_3392_length_6820_cov_6.539652_2_plen_58_part_00
MAIWAALEFVTFALNPEDIVAAVCQDKLLVTTLAGDIMTQLQVLLRTQLQLSVKTNC